MARFGVAVIGTGFIGPVHVEALQRAGQNVVGIVDVVADKARSVADAMHLKNAYNSLTAALQDPEVDAVHITTPNRFHYEMATAALRAGKHVLCEKPLAMNSRESAELVQLAKQANLAAGVAHSIRFYPLCQEAAERVRTQQLGRVYHVTGSYVQDWLLYDTDFNWRVVAAEGGELRAVADIGTHWLDLLQFITGQNVVRVCADLYTVHPIRRTAVGSVETFTGKKTAAPQNLKEVPIDTEDYGAILLEFANGARGSVHVSQVTAGRKNCLRFEIAGSESSLYFNSERPNEMWIGQRSAPNQVLLRDPGLLGDQARQYVNYPGGHNEGFPDAFKQLFKAFYGSIAAGTFGENAPFPTFADGHKELLLCEAILESHRRRAWVDVKH